MDVVESPYGKLIASRNDAYLGRSLFEYGEFSEGEVDFFRSVIGKNDIVCDVGANIGAHTLAFARLARHVFAFEPHPMLYHALSGMVALNELRNVTTANAGCAARDGHMAWQDIDFGQLNNLGAFPLVPYNEKRATKVIRLAVECDFLKIDVEGMELEVLRGATEMIQKKHPILYVEADRREKYRDLVRYIRDLGYHPYWHTPPLFRQNNTKGNPTNIWGRDLCSFNLICVRDKVDALLPAEDEYPPAFGSQSWAEVVKGAA